MGSDSIPKDVPSREPSFRNLRTLHDEHTALLKRFRNHESDDDFIIDLKDYLHRVQRFGVQLDSDNERFEVQDVLNYWSNVLYGLNSPMEDVELAEYVEEEAPDLEMECPYNNVADFMASEVRKTGLHNRLLAESLEKLRSYRLLIIMGPNGSGRSAFVQHILVPALKSGAEIPGSENWRFCEVMTPGSEPLIRLVQTVRGAPASNPESLQKDVRRLLNNGSALTDMLAANDQPSVIVIDDFEQLFTQCTDQHQRQAFADNLHGLVRESSLGDMVIVIMKQSYVSRLGNLGAFAGPAGQLESARGAQVAMSFTANELRRAILGPAELVGLKFDDGLVDRLVLDVQSEPGAIALLQFTMRRLWEAKTRNRITWDAYRRVGAGSVALERTADDFYQQVRRKGQESAMRYLCSRLVRPLGNRDFTTPVVSREQLHDGRDDSAIIDAVLEEIVSAGLVRRKQGVDRSDDTFSLAHAALVEHWPLLIDWLEDERSEQRQRSRLTSAAHQWEDRNRASEQLWKGSLLQEAWNYPDLSPTERTFLEASQAEADAMTRRLWAVIGALTALSCLALVLAYFAVRNAKEAITNENIAERNELVAHAEASLSQGRENLSEGLHTFSEGDWFGSLPWLHQAKVDDQESADYRTSVKLLEEERGLAPLITDLAITDPKPIHNIRIGSVLDQAPRLALCLFQRKNRPVSYVDVSRDGRRAVTVSTFSKESSVELWDLELGQRLYEDELIENNEVVSHASFNLDGSQVVTACDDHQARLWDVESGELLASIPHQGRVTQAIFSPQGKRLLTVLDSTATDNDVTAESESEPETGADPPNEPRFAATVWEVPQKGSELKLDGYLFTLTNHQAPITHAEFDSRADGMRIVTSSQDNTARIWDARNGDMESRLIKTIPHSDSVNWASFSPGGQLMVTACDDKNARLWRRQESGNYLNKATWSHDGEIRTAMFSPDGRYVVTASEDATARVWHVPIDGSNKVVPPRVLRHGSRVAFACFSPDSQHVLTASRDRTARVWDARSGEPISPFLRHRGGVTHAVFGPHGARVFTCSGRVKIENVDDVVTQVADGGELRVWLLNKRITQPVASGSAHELRPTTFPTFAHRGKVTAVTMFRATIAPEGRSGAPSQVKNFVAIASVSETNTGYVQIWNIENGSAITDQIRHVAPVRWIGFSPDGTRMVTGCDDGEARVWDTSSGARITTSSRISHVVLDVDVENGTDQDFGLTWVGYSPDGKYILTCGRDQLARLWDAESGVPLGKPLLHDGAVLHAAFSPDREHFATASEDDLARIWKITSTGAPVFEICIAFHTADVESVCYNSDGSCLVTASVDQTARVWDRTGNAVTPTITHDQAVTSAIFSPDDQLLATVSLDRFVRVWDLTNHVARAKATNGAARVNATLNMPKLVTPPLLQRGDVADLAFEPSELRTASSGNGSVLQINRWSLSTQPVFEEQIQDVWEILTGRAYNAPGNSSNTLIAGTMVPKELTVANLKANWEKLSRSPHYETGFGQEPAILQVSIEQWHRQQANQNDVLGRIEPLIWHLDRLLEEQPSQTRADKDERARLLLRRAQAYSKLKREEDSNQDFEKAIELDPDNQELLLGRAHNYWRFGKLQQAIDDCTKVIKLALEGKNSFGNWNAWHHRARLRAEQAGDMYDARTWEAILDDLRQAIDHGSDNEYTWYYHALACLLLDDQETYRATCRQMDQFFSASTNAQIVNLVVWTSCIAPGAVQRTRAELAKAASDWRDTDRWYYLHTLAIATFRLAEQASDGKEKMDLCRSAIRRLQEAVAARNAFYDARGIPPSDYPIDDLVLALIHHEMKDMELARHKLVKARSSLEDSRNLSWSDRAEFHMLLKEAVTKIDPKD